MRKNVKLEEKKHTIMSTVYRKWSESYVTERERERKRERQESMTEIREKRWKAHLFFTFLWKGIIIIIIINSESNNKSKFIRSFLCFQTDMKVVVM